MFSRTTNDYQAMYAKGIRACVEPSFWLGTNRRYAGSFFDYFQLILEFETVRAKRFGIDHYAAIAVNPKEADNLTLVDEVLERMNEYLEHERCVALGEIGLNLATKNEEAAFVKQLYLAAKHKLPVIVHTPHVDKLSGTKRIIDILRAEDMDNPMVIIDHNTEETVPEAIKTNCFIGMTVYPISKLTPGRVSGIIKEYGAERMIVNGSADWGVSDPLSLPKVAEYMRNDSHAEETIKTIVFDNAMKFYEQSGKFNPKLNLSPIDPKEFQR